MHDYSTEPDHESNFHQWADFTVKYSGGRTVDLNMEINSWLETANKYFTPIKADIKFFESEQCYKYQEFISSLESEFFDGFLKVFVLGVTSESGPQFGVKTVKGTPVGTGKNIRVLDFENEDVPGFNIETYCSKLEDYINYCGCVSPVTIERPPEENEAVSFFSIAPNDIFILM